MLRRNDLYTDISNFGYLLSGTCRQKLSVKWHWLKFYLSQIFLHFGQFYFYSRQVCNKQLANWTAITDTLTLNGFTRNEKHGFNSWKWSNPAWNFPSSLTSFCSILPLCGLQLKLLPSLNTYMWFMWHVSYYLYYDYAVSLTTLSVQLHTYATNTIAKCTHPSTVVKIKAKVFLHLLDMDSANTINFKANMNSKKTL